MRKIKFNDNYSDNNIVFYKNSVWEYHDKREVYFVPGCDDDCDRFDFEYRIISETAIHIIPGNYVTEVDEKGNDYTKQEWNDKITKDALVTDGNYVKAWIDKLHIMKPVKDGADKADYNGSWKSVAKREKEFYGNKRVESA